MRAGRLISGEVKDISKNSREAKVCVQFMKNVQHYCMHSTNGKNPCFIDSIGCVYSQNYFFFFFSLSKKTNPLILKLHFKRR